MKTVDELLAELREKDALKSERELVQLLWPLLSEAQREVVCRKCTSYFPKGRDNFECLSGHAFEYKKPCPSFLRATFMLCPDWEYTAYQVYRTRNLEAEAKKAAGDYIDEDD